jgi:hypothetical protein
MCGFYRQHQATEAARDLSQYVSLALYLEEPPTFTPKVKQTDLPPDAAVLADIVPMMQAFYQKIGLHAIWQRHNARRTESTEIYHDPLAKMTFDTEIYLKLPSSYYLGRQFTVYLDAMARPANQRTQLRIGLLRRDFTDLEHDDQNAADSAYVSALSSDPLAMKNGSCSNASSRCS